MVGIYILRLAQHVVGLAVNENRLRLQKFHIGILLTAGVSTEVDLVELGLTRHHARDLLQDFRCPECVTLSLFINFYQVFTILSDCELQTCYSHEWLRAANVLQS